MEDIGIVFDCDGTLLDSMGMWHSLDDKLAARAGVEFTQADRDYMTSASIPECAEYMHDKCGIGSSADDVISMLDDEMLSFYTSDVVEKPGALDFVKTLHDLGIPMSVASSTPAKLLNAGLEYTGFSPYMRAIVSVDDVGCSKREPAVYDAARAPLKTDRAHTWGFEDSLYAIYTLKRAGYKTLAIYDSDIAGSVSDLKREADMFVMSFSDLDAERFLKQLKSGIRDAM